jgi:tetratricopeptide (TPR) repeat protein
VGAFIKDEIRELKEQIAWMLLDLGEYKKALAMYKSMSWTTQGETKYLGIARALTETGHFNEARLFFEKGLKRFPKSMSLLVGLGNWYHALADYTNSLKYFKKALKYEPDNKFLLFNKGAALFGLGNYEDASIIFQELVEKHPDEIRFLIMMGYCHLQTGYSEDAARHFKDVFDKGYFEPEGYIGLYVAYMDMGLKSDALSIAREGLKKFPDEDPDLYLITADAYLEQSWLNEALDIVKEGLKRFPEYEGLKDTLKNIEDEIDNPDKGKKPPFMLIIRLIALTAILKKLLKKR